MTKDLAGKVAIVTGGSDGIGLATAKLLASRGATVVICARRPEKLEAARQEVAQFGAVEAFPLDVSDEDAFTAMVEDVANRHGRLDMMVNNAMSVHYAPVTHLTMEHWRKDFRCQCRSGFHGHQGGAESHDAAKCRDRLSISRRQRQSGLRRTCQVIRHPRPRSSSSVLLQRWKLLRQTFG
ncbi:MAG: SDR family oxidoreductase [Sphingomonadales bacterium]|nr:SDR family oxidoreductase [Sphingomonadales bacterium]